MAHDLERVASHRLLTSAQMREADRRTIENLGLPGVVLMENAGAAACRILKTRMPEWRERVVVILAGQGNNGGDGFVVGRWLLQSGGRVVVLLLGRGADLKGDARIHHGAFVGQGGVVRELLPGVELADVLHPLLLHCSVVVDAIFGTGLARSVEGLAAELIRLVARSGKPVLAVDIPSGVCADTGRILGCALPARWTVTFAAEKRGHRLYPGAGLVGELIVAPIGIPESFLNIPEHDVALNVTEDLVIPKRSPDAHKGDCGRLLVVAGGVGMEGAAILVAQGAARVGAGLITVATPAAAQPVVTAGLTEAMTLPLPLRASGEPLLDIITKGRFQPDVLAIGPGLGENEQTWELVTAMMAWKELPTLLDADALNVLAGQGERIRHWSIGRRTPLILTPHPGEMARLWGMEVNDVRGDRLAIARRTARDWGVWVVLKGAGSVIAAPDGRAWINATGNPGLAAGGSGDLLTGIIAGLLAQDWPVESAVRAGVWLHGAAADACAAEQGMVGMLAGDLLPHTRRLRNGLG
ncbi:Bifunctional NAD(P)H-hydrate repair enzyme Nnr [Candidatus Magnetaquicoccaceae bacterium FCR-1]|uniref:Bifunctional NAD(P)H-hydrate repair enzyme n=1 Tax=Candidatus Magnetaquiglobus chichijimensis TaxID=3141448 RepID=A0ABQ0CD03_9PROT